jgi:hypothetical protein
LRPGQPVLEHGRSWYPRVPLPGLPWSPEFMAAHEAAIDFNFSTNGGNSEMPRSVRSRAAQMT